MRRKKKKETENTRYEYNNNTCIPRYTHAVVEVEPRRRSFFMFFFFKFIHSAGALCYDIIDTKKVSCRIKWHMDRRWYFEFCHTQYVIIKDIIVRSDYRMLTHYIMPTSHNIYTYVALLSGKRRLKKCIHESNILRKNIIISYIILFPTITWPPTGHQRLPKVEGTIKLILPN